ncbi:hypothetical protein MMC16_006712 [Acarospora aff. strigata]|nr:hypothetical protein [Acarospora aff. strigata]
MSSANNTTYLITGIGKGLVSTYLGRPNSIVVAGVRDPSSSAAKELSSLPAGHGSSVIVVKIDSGSESDAAAAVQELKSTHHITKLDTVIANAGISTSYAPIADVPPAVLQEHVTVNAVGPLVLFQAVLPLLQASSQPKFVLVGSPLGSIAGMEQAPAPMTAYGASKAMAHYLVRKMHNEHPNLIAFVLDPGFVQTDMGNQGASVLGMPEPPTSVKDSVEFLVATIDGATREKTSGHFPSIRGGDSVW